MPLPEIDTKLEPENGVFVNGQRIAILGSSKSGHYGHAGIPGHRGGSAARGLVDFSLLQKYEQQSPGKFLHGGKGESYMDSSLSAGGQTLQEAVLQKFGGNWEFRKTDKVLYDELEDAKKEVNVMYTHTQTVLEKEGVSSVQLYRGLALDDVVSGEKILSLTNPVASWTQSIVVAEMFASLRASGTGKKAVILKADIPINKILTCGGLNSARGMELASEWLVLGGDGIETEVMVK